MRSRTSRPRRASFANSANWLKALKDSATYGGRLYGVPYYGGARVVTYRTDLFKKAGANKPPTSLAAYTALAKKLAAQNSGKGFSPVYIAGQDWYVGLGFVYDYGGQIAKVYRGKWQAHARLAEGDRRADGVQEVLRRRVKGQQVDDRDEAVAVRGLRTGSGGLGDRLVVVQLLRR